MAGEYQKPLRLVSTGGGMRYYRSNETALEGARAQGRGVYQLESVRGRAPAPAARVQVGSAGGVVVLRAVEDTSAEILADLHAGGVVVWRAVEGD